MDLPLHYHEPIRQGFRRFMWKIRKSVDSNRLVLGISGRIEEGQLPQFTKALVSEAWKDGVILDLKDVKLVDQACVTFLASCEAAGWTLCNCPHYVRAWIDGQHQPDVSRTEGA